MTFTQRNLYYLRASPHIVLQTVLYLDPKHLRWMNAYYGDDEDDENDAQHPAGRYRGDLVLAKALQVLKTRIMPKLRRESQEGGPLGSTNKKEQVDVHVDVDFQMAYFFKKVPGRHAVLLKEKAMLFPQAPSGPMAPPAFPASAARKRKQGTELPRPSDLAARQGLQAGESVVEEGADVAEGKEPETDGDGGSESLRKRRRGLEVMGIRVKEEDDDEVQPLGELNGALASTFVKQEDGEEEAGAAPLENETIDLGANDDPVDDKKPKIHVNYSGFKIFGKMLVLVIEPSRQMKKRAPELFAVQTAAPTAQQQMRRISETPVPSSSRGPPDVASMRTPSRARSSFLEDEDEDEHPRDSRNISRTPARSSALGRGLFRGTPSEYEATPTPTPEPEGRRIQDALQSERDDDEEQEEEEDEGGEEQVDQSASFILASQMLEDGVGGEGNDIDDDAGD